MRKKQGKKISTNIIVSIMIENENELNAPIKRQRLSD